MAKNMDINNNSFTINDIMDVTPSQRIAMLIDGDNAQPSMIEKMLAETTKYGLITIRRIYGDWTASNMGGWKEVLQTHAIQPIQQFRYTVGKNATDSAMIIDAMDLFYSGVVDGFCLVSSDSDFTRLATRLREAGKIVYGIGEKKTPTPFVAACDRFIFLEILAPKEKKTKNPENSSAKALSQADSGESPDVSDSADAENKSGARVPKDIDEATCELIASSVSDLADEDGWAFLGDVGNLVNKKSPSFDARNYGFSKMSKLMQSLDFLECELRVNEKNPQVKLIYVRNKEDN